MRRIINCSVEYDDNFVTSSRATRLVENALDEIEEYLVPNGGFNLAVTDDGEAVQ